MFLTPGLAREPCVAECPGDVAELMPFSIRGWAHGTWGEGATRPAPGLLVLVWVAFLAVARLCVSLCLFVRSHKCPLSPTLPV